MDDFQHLHTHSDMSSLDGCASIASYVKGAKERGNRGIAITDHGTMRGYINLHDECEKANIKPVYGVEFYVCNDMNRKGLTDDEKKEISSGKTKSDTKKAIADYEKIHGIRSRTHLTVFAQNQEGMKNLYRLTSKSYIEGYYYKPRIDINTLIKHETGLIVASGCIGSELNQKWLVGKKRQAMELSDRLHSVFKDRFLLELQPHGIPDQAEANKFTLQLRERFSDSRLIATQDAHYVKQGHATSHECLLCIGTRNVLSDPNHFKFSNDEFFMKSKVEMIETFKKHHNFIPDHLLNEAINSTIDVVDRCNVKLNLNHETPILPDVILPEGFEEDTKGYLYKLCLDGQIEKDIHNKAKLYSIKNNTSFDEAMKVYTDRLLYELKVINDHGFNKYFIIVHDIYSFAKNKDIMVGPGRGSVAGSLVAYLLGLTSVDPIEYGLMFERFINESRIDFPDIDMDFEDLRRKEVFEYLKQKYDKDKICQITTVGKLSGKSCVKDVSRVLEVPYIDANTITKFLIERDTGDERVNDVVLDSFKQIEECKVFNEKYPDVLKHSKVLEGLSKTLGIHAAGVVISPIPLSEILPLEVRKSNKENIIVSSVDMRGIEKLGLVKLDVLGSKTLTVLKGACKAIEERQGISIELEKIDLEDPEMLQGFSDGYFEGVFQYDSPIAQRLCEGLKFDCFDDIVAISALNRPGSSRSGSAQTYVSMKKNPDKLKERKRTIVSDITSDTLGIIVYQEHVIKILVNVAGYTACEADVVRKLISKSAGSETINKEREKFVKGAMNTVGMSEEESNKLMDNLIHFGGYSFNKSHATAYSMLSAWTMYIKIKYPLEFYYSVLRNEQDSDKIKQFIRSANVIGVKILQPSVNTSKVEFSINLEYHAINSSLVDLKGVGPKAAESIQENQPYTSILDFLTKVDRRCVHEGVIKTLVKSRALDDMVPNAKWFVENIKEVLLVAKKDTEKFQNLINHSKNEPGWSEEDKVINAAFVNPMALQCNLINFYKKFLDENIEIPLTLFDNENFYSDNNEKTVLIACTIVSVKLTQIGEYYSGPLLSNEEKRKKFWGKTYATVTVEGEGGVQRRVKFEHEVYPLFKNVLELDIGSPIIMMVKPNSVYRNIKAYFALSLEMMRNRLKYKEDLNIFGKIITGEKSVKKVLHGVKDSASLKELKKKGKKKIEFSGAVLNVRSHYDKKGDKMGFFSLIDGCGEVIDCVCFSKCWFHFKSVMKIGKPIKISLTKEGDTYFYKGNL